MSDNRFTDPAPSAKNVWSGVLFGIGLMALIDEIIFHQLLQWHHFYDRSTPYAGIFTDGLLNAFALFAIVSGLFMFADLHRKHTIHMMRWIASVLIGSGGFQLFDGIINHKVLQIHKVRYGVDILPYDLAWNTFGALLLIAGIVLFLKFKKQYGRRRAEG
ncbi:DUF2243 domain-containing protein [Salinicoccus sp. HZC-1]|uniref:DUF2243 domain-containing protein n=1 Tax=Salinicoccus sp. HZC-1 TaxID=3385497 RepID=UPI00398A6258